MAETCAIRRLQWNCGTIFALTSQWHLTPHSQKETPMLGWALTFLVIALIAAALGFGGIAGTSAGIAQILFFVFIVLFVVAMIARALQGRPPL
jgi:uncharacterized membrane protein YtjA (UPF0391 family)